MVHAGHRIGALFIAVVAGLVSSTAYAGCDSSLVFPPDMKVVAPAADVPSGLAALGGKWCGNWGGLGGALVVQSVGADGKIDAIYAWGEGVGLKAGSQEFMAVVKNGSFGFGEPAADFSFVADGANIDGKRIAKSGPISKIVLYKQK